MNSTINTPYFDSIISDLSEDFEGGLKGTTRGRLVQKGGYMDKRNKDLIMRKNITLNERMDQQAEFVRIFMDYANGLRPLMTDYDVQEGLSSTCALSVTKPGALDLDLLGDLGAQGNSNHIYPDNVKEAIYEYYVKIRERLKLDLKTPIPMTLPRMRNVGWPCPVATRDRNLSDILLALHVALHIGGESAHMSLKEIVQFLSDLHGEPFTAYAERYQHTEKTMPLLVGDRVYYSKNFVPRVRGIYMSPKVAVARNRRVVKLMNKLILETPMHNQDRNVIRNRIDAAIRKGWHVLPLDYSKYDQSQGHPRGAQILQVINKIVGGNQATMDDLLTEYYMPILTFSRKGPYIFEGAPIMTSGASFTSVVNTVGNDLNVCEVLSKVTDTDPKRMMALIGHKWDVLSWGDDTVLMLDRTFDVDKIMHGFGDIVGIKVTEEVTVKYLGVHYSKGRFQGTMDTYYPISRWIQQELFPERKKDFPFSVIGYIARTSLLDPNKQNDIHKFKLSRWDVEKMGPKFEWRDRHDVLENLMPEVQKRSDLVAQIDDILNIFTHGTDDLELVPDDDLRALLTGNSIDVSDPAKVMSDSGMSDHEIGLLSELMKGKFDNYIRFVEALIVKFNLQWRRHDVIY